ncbi:MAG: tetratricopeptide repeat protein [Burkholderiaceae bacterium]|nr:tetratricopeptide repeat protein [Burkholderiaceae bacterium]
MGAQQGRKIRPVEFFSVTGAHLKNTLLIVILSAALSAIGGAQAWAQDKPQEKPAAVTAQPDAGKGQAADPLPEVQLTREILFKLLSADLAFQRGYWKAAYNTTMSVAKQTRDPRIARRAAEMAAAVQRPGEALAAVRLWRELAPHSDEAARYFLGFVLLSGELTEAKPVLARQLKEARPQDRAIVMFQIQRLLAGVTDKEKAFSLLEELLKPYLNTPEAHIALAQGAYNKGDRERATQESQRALAIKPDSELAALTLAQASSDADHAEKVLADFIAAHPQARDVRIAYARVLIAQKKYDVARHEFEALLELQPKDLVSLYSLGLLSAQANDARNAERYLAAYVEAAGSQKSVEREQTQVLLLLAQLADERGDIDTALKWLEQIEQQPGNQAAYVGARIKRAQIAAKRGEIGSARKILSETEAQDEAGQVQLIMAHGQLLRDANQLPQAMAVLEAGLKQYPKNTNLLYDYAMVAEKLDRIVEMETSLRLIIALEPNNFHAYNALGYSLADRNLRLLEAQELIEHALKLAPEDAFILDSMGWVQFRLGKIDEAEKLLRRALGKRGDAEIAVHLGEVLWHKGQQDEARKLWRAAAAKDPGNDALKSTLKRLKVAP